MKISGLALAALLCAPSAQAQLSGVVDVPGGDVINLYRDDGPCVSGAHRAEYVNLTNKQTIPGCWTVKQGGVLVVVWFDTDTSAIPLRLVRQPKEV